MIVISPKLFDPSAPLVVPRPGGSTSLEEAARRVTRTATLDGGAAIYDGGYSDADRSITVELPRPTTAQVQTAIRLVQLSPLVVVAARDGLYLAVPESYSVSSLSGRSLILSLLITARVSA